MSTKPSCREGKYQGFNKITFLTSPAQFTNPRFASGPHNDVVPSGRRLLEQSRFEIGYSLNGELINPQAIAISIPSQLVVYAGVRRSCFMDHTRRSPSRPALAIFIVPLPKR